MAIDEFPDDVSAEGLTPFSESRRQLSQRASDASDDAEEFKAATEKVKNVKSSYTPLTATKQ